MSVTPLLKSSLSLLVSISSLIACVSCTEKASEHPKIYGTDATKADLTEKIENVTWAKDVYQRLKESVDPYVDRHQTDPDWIVSRLQMHWKTKYTENFLNGAVWSHGSGEAPVPTVRFAGGRDWNSDFNTPAIEDVQPFAEDPRGMWLQNHTKEGQPWEWAPIDQTGHTIERINERILALAEKSAFLYWYTGNEKYGSFAEDIFWTYTLGMYHRSTPQTYENHAHARIIGLVTFEVIHERVTASLAVCYDYLHDRLKSKGRDLSIVETVFKRWADRIIEGGGSKGNWNINQARYIVYLGLTLQDNDAYEDGKGLQYYISQLTTESSKNQSALKKVVPETYDPVSGVWPEAPGYAFSVTDTILKLAQMIHNATGEDILEDYPIIVPAATVSAQYLYPSGYFVGFGDTYHEVPYTQSFEMLLARFRRTGDQSSEQQVADLIKEQIELNGYQREKAGTLLALTSYVDTLPQGKSEESLRTRTFYTDKVNYLAQRNAKDKENGLMVSLAGTTGGHDQANGMAMELYGKGLVMGPDFGRGPSYWTKSHDEFYLRFAAHNTVAVDGISNYSFKEDHLFEIIAVEPAPESHTPISENYSFSDTSFTEPKTDARQRRLLSIVRTSDTTGYYVDIFRSARKDGADKKNDYFYHNIGQSLTLSSDKGKVLTPEASDLLGSKQGDHVGYDYFDKEAAIDWNKTFNAVFDIDLKDKPDVGMNLWMLGEEGRRLFTAESPVARTLLRGSAPEHLQTIPVPTLIVQQKGPAWDKPFVAIYEPFDTATGKSVSGIRKLDTSNAKSDLVALAVSTKNQGTQYILNATDPNVANECESIRFAGTFGIISEKENTLTALYIGNGTLLEKADISLKSTSEPINATLEKVGDTLLYSSDGEIEIRIGKQSKIFPAAQNAPINF